MNLDGTDACFEADEYDLETQMIDSHRRRKLCKSNTNKYHLAAGVDVRRGTMSAVSTSN